MMKVTAELLPYLFTEPVPAVSDKESSDRSCMWLMHLPAAFSALSVSTCGWYGWNLEHTDGSHSTFPPSAPVQSSVTQLGGVDPSHNETGKTELPMAYIKNHYRMRKHKDRKTTKQVRNCLFQQLRITKRESVFF